MVTREVAEHPAEVFETLSEYGYLQFIPCLDSPGRDCPWVPDAQTFGRFLTETFRLYRRAMQSGRYVSVRLFDNWLNMQAGREPDSCAQCGRCAPYFVVEADGSVYPCDFYAQDEWRLGNINETTFERLSRSPLEQRFLQGSYAVPEACRTCRSYPLCRNGCRRERDEATGLNRYCAGYRSTIERLPF